MYYIDRMNCGSGLSQQPTGQYGSIVKMASF